MVGYALITENSNLEFAFKLITLFTLSFLYLESTLKVSHWYVMVLLFTIISDSLFIFDDFYFFALYFLIANRFLYLIIIRKSIVLLKTKVVFSYALPIVFAFFVIYFMIYEYLDDIQIIAFILGITSVALFLIAYLNFLKRNDKRAKYYFLGTSLLPFADILMAFTHYIDFHMFNVIIYHLMYYIGRYLVYRAMIMHKKGMRLIN